MLSHGSKKNWDHSFQMGYKSLKAMATGAVSPAKSAKEQRINVAAIPSTENGEDIWYLWCLQCSVQLSQ